MFSDSQLPGIEKARLIERDQHPISRKQISPNALKVLYKLEEAGYHSYLVGGGVRDLFLGRQPKDFDIATEATPAELKNLFRNARIIGRRFMIVHLRFGREIIEVTTFRAHHQVQNQIGDDVSRRQIQGLDSAHSSDGMILRDNVYGEIDEDALRRDFTINALYYTINKFRVLDFSTGIEDLQAGQIRIIGDAEERYREDPVRMLRAIRFSAKLNFAIAPDTAGPISGLAHLLDSISPARLFDETLKLLSSGYAVDTFSLLREYNLSKQLFPDTLDAIEDDDLPASKLVGLALRNTDDRLRAGKSVTPAFLFAALLWPALQQNLRREKDGSSGNPYQLLQQAANTVVIAQLQYTAVPKRFTIAAKEIWELQLRLERRNRRSIESAYDHPRFRAAYDFLLLREESGEELNDLGKWWTDYQVDNPKERSELVAAVAKPKRRRRRKRQSSERNSSDTPE